MSEYTTTTIGNYYTTTGGIYLDEAKPGHKDRMHKYDSQTLMIASTKDDGITYGISTEVNGNDEVDSIQIRQDKNPYIVDNLDDVDVTFVSQTKGGATTAASEMWNSIGFANYVRFRWRTNLVVNAGNLIGIACKIRDSGNWTVKWTGVPKIDQWITNAGKQIYDVSVDYFMICDATKTFNPVFEWTLSFGTSYKSVWNFIMTSVQTVMSTPYFNYSLFPAIAYVDHNRYTVLDNLAERDEEQEDNASHSEKLTHTGIYPPLPSAPLEDTASGTDATRRKVTTTALKRLKRFFKPSKKT